MKNVRIVAFLLLMVLAVTALVACGECDHNYVDGTCAECGEADPNYVAPCTHEYAEGVCTKCGEADPDYVAPCEHEYAEGVCTKCGAADPDYVAPCVHVPGEPVEVEYVAATCTVGGYRDSVIRCTVCNEEIGELHEDFDPTGHSFTNYVSNNDATCTADGTKTAKCDNCDVTDTVADEGSMAEHSFTDYVSNNDATCAANGTKTAKCDNCDATDTVEDEGTQLEHSFTEYVSDNNATCAANGTKTAKCDNCDATDTVEDEGTQLEHSFTEYVSDENATCTEDGTKTAKCDNCDATDTVEDEGSALGHSYSNALCLACGDVCSNHTYDNGACTNCGMPCAHKFSVGVCTVCGFACESHTYGTNGLCTVCFKSCAHTYEEGVCGICGKVCTHWYNNGACTVCGALCENHEFENGVCTLCKKACEHDYDADGYCTICTMEDPNYIPADGGKSLHDVIIAKLKELALYYDTNGELPALGEGEPEYVSALYSVFNTFDSEIELGYAIKDINSDGRLELIVMNRESKVYALFTLVGREAALVATFEDENNCYIDEDGMVYFYVKTVDGTTQMGIAYSQMHLVDGELVGIEFGWNDGDGDPETDDRVWYKKEGGVSTELTNDEYKVYSNHVYEYYIGNPTILAKLANLIFNPALGEIDNTGKSTADFSTYDKIIETFDKMYNEAVSQKFDKSKWRKGEYDNGMIFNSEEDYATYNRLLCAVVMLQGSSSSSKYGYALKDLNGDGINELILMDQYGSGTSMRHDIFAIFTQDADGNAILLDIYSDTRFAVIGADGYIYVAERVIPGHKKDMIYTVYEVKDGALAVVSAYGCNCDYATTSTQIGWYKLVNGEKVEVTQDEFNEFYNAKIQVINKTINASNVGKYNAKNSGLTLVQIEKA